MFNVQRSMYNQCRFDKNISKFGCQKGINVNNHGQSPRMNAERETTPKGLNISLTKRH